MRETRNRANEAAKLAPNRISLKRSPAALGETPTSKRRSRARMPAPANHVLPHDAIAIVPVRNVVLFPGALGPLSMGRARSIAAIEDAQRNRRSIGLLLQKDPAQDEPGETDLHAVGTLASIAHRRVAPDKTQQLVCQGEQRFRIKEFLPGLPFLAARIERLEEPQTLTPDIEARTHQLRERTSEVLALLPQVPTQAALALENLTNPGALADMVASLLELSPQQQQSLLETVDLQTRLDRLLELLSHQLEVLRISAEIGKQTREALDERQREVVLREQLRTIQRELGEDEGRSAELGEIAAALDGAGLPTEVAQQARKELRRLERLGESSAEGAQLRTWLEWITELPWQARSEERIDLAAARAVLEEDHYGLEKVKRRILEFLAVRKLNPEGKSPILCFAGPPGVGKTSLGTSIARATHRVFGRISLGGVHDEAEIRGHRRTYIGALPGNVIQALRKAGTCNPVLLFDEIDKLGAGGFHGDPASALLEVLDPEQNATFRDNYLGVPFDLSSVLFVCTANQIEGIPHALRDRLELIPLPGYSQEEKIEIARRYLVPRQGSAHGLTPEQAALPDDLLAALIAGYTREAGVRQLEREIGAVFRHLAFQIAEGSAPQPTVTPEELPAVLGQPRFENEVAMRTAVPGVATGLAWTPVGGDILFIEATRVPGSGQLLLTGQLGGVMKESAQAALSTVKAQFETLGLAPSVLARKDLHLHVPAGATPKDGPSAGVAMHVALVSLLTGRPVRPDVAMTGEISLRGLVLPVGGIREKVLAAHRAGIHTVLLPARNRRDLEELPASVRERIQFVFLDRLEDAVAAALAPAASHCNAKESAHAGPAGSHVQECRPLGSS